MPELPEVETIKLGLEGKIIGLTIKDIQILTPKSFQGDVSQIVGKKVVGVFRRAKMLGLELANNSEPTNAGPVSKQPHLRPRLSQVRLNRTQVRLRAVNGAPRFLLPALLNPTLVFHLKMSGQVIYVGKERFVGGHPTLDMLEQLPNRSTRVIFTFSDNSQLFFNDQRKFGWIKLVQNDEIFVNLGPEPLEKSFTWKTLKENLLKHKNWPVKVGIMDQGVVVGVGNIYANEAVFLASLDPRTKIADLTDQDFKNIYQGIIKALKDGIKYGGSTRTHFVNAEGKKGMFLDYAYVYNRGGDICKICGTIIKKITLGGRGTYYCPKCQKNEKTT